jgi:hypothetical protein
MALTFGQESNVKIYISNYWLGSGCKIVTVLGGEIK